MNRVLFVLGIAWIAVVLWGTPARAAASSDRADLALEAYRRGEYPQAAQLWQDSLREEGPSETPSARHGILCYNIGNALYRQGKAMQAIAWYQAGLRHLPRNADLRANLGFARGELGLPPAEGDGLLDTLAAWLGRWTPAEARWIALLGVGILAAGLLLEALRGGALGRRAAWAGGIVCLLLLGPWLQKAWAPDMETMMVVAERGAAGRSEPRADARSLAQLEPTEAVYPKDTWQDWTKVQTREGVTVWVLSDKLLSTWR
ncbi:MAG: tetratricopeptide repeat protein [Planctomycetes bacterium]|nr:tetratricopeptide repeat protein [Planctomycetota bacterium]MCB9908794.1 tetratricopeptide repeat protein [Planctomycetota bacterium]MCB9912381.1 tetratricopeptide repeat protein [Planctomycetota bacterium]